jgi:hypothetical protein
MAAVAERDSKTGRDELYIMFDGVRIAKRGYPKTPQAGTWVPIEPGFEVYDGEKLEDGSGELVIIKNGVRVQ